MSVNAFRVVASTIQPFKVGIAGRDWPHVLGPVELALLVFVVAVQPDRDDATAVFVRESVAAVPAVATGLRFCTVRAQA